MRRIIALAALALVATGCTQGQYLRYVDAVLNGHEPEAKAAVAAYEQERAEATAGHHCAEWYDAAIDAGFTPEQWQEPVSRVMYRESMCNPSADNSSSTADGLMQIVRGTWLSSCPNIPYADRYNGEANLRCAFQVSGGGIHWSPWSTY